MVISVRNVDRTIIFAVKCTRERSSAHQNLHYVHDFVQILYEEYTIGVVTYHITAVRMQRPAQSCCL